MGGMTSLRPRARAFYDAMIASYGDALATSEGTHLEAVIFATARAFGVAAKIIGRANNAIFPSRMYEVLEDREQELGIIPPAGATITERCAVLKSRLAFTTGVTGTALRNALLVILADDFLGLYNDTPATAQTFPTTIAGKELNLVAPTTPRKILRLTEPVLFTGSPVSISYEMIRGDIRSTNLLAGDRLAVDCGQLGLEETVVVSSVVENFLTATFQVAHSAGAVCTTAPYPAWRSTKRHTLIGLSTSAATDPQTRRAVDEELERRMRAVSTWSICDSSGPFKIGIGLLGVTPFGAVEFS